MRARQSVEQFRESSPHFQRSIARFPSRAARLKFAAESVQIFRAPRAADEGRFKHAGLGQVVTQETLQGFRPQGFVFHQSFEAERVRCPADGQGGVGQLQQREQHDSMLGHLP